MIRRLWVALLFAWKGGEGEMAMIYATLIVKGAKDYEDVPAVLREQVRQILIDLELPELVSVG